MYFGIFWIALLTSFVMFFPSLAISKRLGAIDIPSQRKIHTEPIARGGGFAFFMSFSGLLALMPINADLKLPLLAGGSAIFVVGLIDDARPLTPFQKLSGEFLAAGCYILFSAERSLAHSVLTFAWIMFLSNAINLCDGLDGLAGGITASETLCLGALALIFGNGDVFICALALLGAISGFLPRNFPRAKIFMGDCGALFLGFTLGALSSRLVFESGSILCLVATLLAFRVPTYDTNLSIVRRLIKGKNPFRADKGHFHHRLLRWGFTKECATLALVTASLYFGLAGIIIASL